MASAHLDHPEVWAPQIVEDHFNARYIALAGFTLMIWSHLTTLDEEIRYIWNNDAGVTLNKTLFVAVRYFTTLAFGFHCLTLFITQPSPKMCQALVISVGAEALGLVGACDLILLLRTWAIYDRTRRSLFCLAVLLVVTNLPTLVLGARWMTTLRIGPSKLYPVIPGCFLQSTAMEDFWHVTFPSVIYNTALTGASIYKIWTYHRTRIKTPLLSLLVRDGMVSYVIILTVYLCNGFFLFHRRLVVITIEGRFITCIIAVTCAQLQLNLRTAVQRVPEYATTYYRQPSVFDGLDGRLNSPYRPGVDTLMLGSTATEFEHKHGNSFIENEAEQGEQHYSPDIELTTTAVHTPQRTTGYSQRQPSHSSLDITVIPNGTPDEARYPSTARNTQSEPSCSGLVARADAPSAGTTRVAHGVDSRHTSTRAEVISSSSSSTAVTSSEPKAQDRDTFMT